MKDDKTHAFLLLKTPHFQIVSRYCIFHAFIRKINPLEY